MISNPWTPNVTCRSEDPKDNLRAGDARVIPSDLLHIPRFYLPSTRQNIPRVTRALLPSQRIIPLATHSDPRSLSKDPRQDFLWTRSVPLLNLARPTRRFWQLVSHRKPTDENFRKPILPHISWKMGPEDCEEDGILVILWVGTRLVEDEISWISGRSYMEGRKAAGRFDWS